MWGARSMRLKPLFSQFLLLIAVLTSCAPTLNQEKAGITSPAPLRTTVGSDSSASAVPAGSSSAYGADGSSVCLSCHDYLENHHPTDVIPPAPYTIPFPLYNSQIRCLTCHTGDHMGSSYMLRGGPYTDRREVCFLCHYEEEYRQIDPHIMLDSDGRITEVNNRPVCLVCHSKMPDPRVDRTKDVSFRADVAFLCWRCHSLMGIGILNQHILLKPSLQMLSRIKSSEEKMTIILPLIPRERMTCSTCHNPHQKGVIIHEPSAKGADAPDRLRLQEADLCVACHVM